MQAWRIACKKPDGSPYSVRFRAADALTARQLAVAEGHAVDPATQPELISEPLETISNKEPGQVGAMISIVVAITAIPVPMLAVAAVVIGAQAASDSHGKRGWFGLLLGIVVVVGWQIAAGVARH